MMTASGNALNFFNQLQKNESLDLLKFCILNRIKVHVVEEDQVKTLVCYLDNLSSLNKFYVICSNYIFNLQKKYSFCVSLNQKIYFFKSDLVQDKKGLCIDGDINIYELRRRKHTRFDLPSGWNQSCLIYQTIKKNPKLRARILNLSWSGIRVEIESEFAQYRLNQQIQFSIQIHRRSEILCAGSVKYLKQNKYSGPSLGLEFTNLSNSFENKIKNMCDDLLRYHVLSLKKRP
jgi:hypothetical protein